MKSLEKSLGDAARQVRHEVVRREWSPSARNLHRRLARRRTTASLSVMVLIAGTVGATAFLVRPSEDPIPVSSAFELPAFKAYETAARDVVACMTDAGYIMGGPFRFGEEGAGMAYGIGGPSGADPRMYLSMWRQTVDGEDGALADLTWEQCERDANYRQLERAWFRAYEPYLLPWGVWVGNLLECLTSSGYPIPDWVDQDALKEELPGGTMFWNESHRWLQDAISQGLIVHGCSPWES